MSQVWNKEAIQALLQRSDKAVVQALKTIYARQTATEQRAHQTTDANNRGFTAFDAEVLTDIAQKLPRYNDRLTMGQLKLVRRRIQKYWRQLLEEIPDERRVMPDRVVVALTPAAEAPAPAATVPASAEPSRLWGAF